MTDLEILEKVVTGLVFVFLDVVVADLVLLSGHFGHRQQHCHLNQLDYTDYQQPVEYPLYHYMMIISNM